MKFIVMVTGNIKSLDAKIKAAQVLFEDKVRVRTLPGEWVSSDGDSIFGSFDLTLRNGRFYGLVDGERIPVLADTPTVTLEIWA